MPRPFACAFIPLGLFVSFGRARRRALTHPECGSARLGSAASNLGFDSLIAADLTRCLDRFRGWNGPAEMSRFDTEGCSMVVGVVVGQDGCGRWSDEWVRPRGSSTTGAIEKQMMAGQLSKMISKSPLRLTWFDPRHDERLSYSEAQHGTHITGIDDIRSTQQEALSQKPEVLLPSGADEVATDAMALLPHRHRLALSPVDALLHELLAAARHHAAVGGVSRVRQRGNGSRLKSSWRYQQSGDGLLCFSTRTETSSFLTWPRTVASLDRPEGVDEAGGLLLPVSGAGAVGREDVEEGDEVPLVGHMGQGPHHGLLGASSAVYQHHHPLLPAAAALASSLPAHPSLLLPRPSTSGDDG
ncbi:hypothetical protein BHM03_00057645 [Ensete ventricosum]|nr:hypothetical protein BHM03_00057645 [Ensete ventricosum]